MLSYDLPSLHSVTFRGRRLPRTFVAPANCAAPCDHCSIDTINYTTQGVHYASVNDDINLRFCSLTCANLCTITIWHSPRKNNFNRVCAIICVQQCSIVPGLGPSLYLCICVLACICVFVFVSFPDEKTTDSTRLQMLRGKPPSTTKIAALIPIVKKKL